MATLSLKEPRPTVKAEPAKKQPNYKERKRADGKAAKEWAKVAYPDLFTGTRKPLKIGIYGDLLNAKPDAISKNGIRMLLAYRCSHASYLKALLVYSDRYDLDSNVAGQVTQAQKKIAKKQLYKLNAGV